MAGALPSLQLVIPATAIGFAIAVGFFLWSEERRKRKKAEAALRARLLRSAKTIPPMRHPLPSPSDVPTPVEVPVDHVTGKHKPKLPPRDA